mmetsp:Transcript_10919/g.27785  ORF Transcript_10919/g.27785 Transcript_10919/m.27785 type:complete len:271 (-) Transcript_10919:327-1139(-)
MVKFRTAALIKDVLSSGIDAASTEARKPESLGKGRSTDLCQQLLEQVREPLDEVREGVKAAAAAYGKAMGRDDLARLDGSTRVILATMGSDADARLADRKLSPQEWAMLSVIVARLLDGNPGALPLVKRFEFRDVVAAAARELNGRGRAVSARVDDDGALSFKPTDSMFKRSQNRRKLASLARITDRCRHFNLAITHFVALVDPSAARRPNPAADDSPTPNSSTDSLEPYSAAGLPTIYDDHDDDGTNAASVWAFDSFDAFLEDSGPVSF